MIVVSKLWIGKTQVVVILKLRIIATRIVLIKATKIAEGIGCQIAEHSYSSAQFIYIIFWIMVTRNSPCFLLFIKLHNR